MDANFSLKPIEEITSPTLIPSGSNQQSPIEAIPVELFIEIFRLLEVKDLYRVSLVCKRWKLLINQENLWRLLCQRDFSGFSLFNPLKSQQTWKLTYQLLKQVKREEEEKRRREEELSRSQQPPYQSQRSGSCAYQSLKGLSRILNSN